MRRNASGEDRANRIPWPPIVQAVTLAAAWFLERISPSNLLPQDTWVRAVGAALFIVAFAVAISGIRYFRSIGTAVDPTKPASQLAQGGVFAWTRNPMYLGFSVAMLGLALLFASGWLLAFALLDPLILQKLAIEREEAYLTRRFGAAYTAYCARVRRWL